MTDRPNILFVVIDQLRADCLTGALADHVDLPNLQALRADAVTFLNHYSVCNPCGPSRASILTGQYAMNHGSVRNGTPLPHDTPTLGTEARRAGYRPMLFGYTDIARDPRQHHPNDPDIHTYEAVAAGFDELVEMRLDESFPWRAYLKSKDYDLPDYSLFYAPQGSDPCDPAFYRAEDSDTAFLTDCVLRDLAVRPPGWFAQVTYIRPHPPFVAPEPYNRMYDPASLPRPESVSVEHPFLDATRQSKTAASCVQGLPDLPDSEETTAKLRALYLGLASEVDHHVGRLLSFLKDTGQFDDTMIVITADHGETLGDQGCWGKSSYLNSAFHTPLIIRDPRKPNGHGRDVVQPTESIDLTPTILSRIGVMPPDTMDGRDLGVFLDGDVPTDWRSHSFSELDFGDPIEATNVQVSLGLGASEANLAILRDGTHSLVHFNGGLPAILFDHTDEGEARNIADDPQSAEKMLMLSQSMLDHRMSNPGGRFAQTMVSAAGVKTAPRHASGDKTSLNVAKVLRESASL
ncbi:sulfatase-like hydrolase/transferase [Boseongicola aestuarii]|uniref:Arylsulfatase n=1 Tax=Boseongicola aestuarii TaxID=1470561 RepID=A0A238J0B2_9RHOB|nr:sulfatase-like hydrolase/transferase [Boseongicola aestuarii]SMX23751.1 Arylsulfatase [Boseongicola aestuarii]